MLVNFGEEGIDEMLVHCLPFPQGVEVNGAVFGHHLQHIGKKQEYGLFVDLEEFILGQEESRFPEEVIVLVEGRFVV